MYEQQIAKGMAWLDHQHPGWDRSVDLQYLELKDCTFCVLGQLGGFWLETRAACDYSFGLSRDSDGDLIPTTFAYVFRRREINAAWEWAIAHGFAIGKGDYDVLTEAWRLAIQHRRNDALPEPTHANWWAEGVCLPVIAHK